jgi:hypothetical protein
MAALQPKPCAGRELGAKRPCGLRFLRNPGVLDKVIANGDFRHHTFAHMLTTHQPRAVLGGVCLQLSVGVMFSP